MTKIKLFAASLLIFSFTASGCVLLLVGAGAAGGYAVSKDEIEGLNDASRDKVWSAAHDVIKSEGMITLESKDTGEIKAIVDASDVEIHIDQATPKTVRTRIKARKTKGLFPDIDLAQSLYTKVFRKLK